jgi:N-dimethylarginine dimethylaminohydrolase
MHFDAAQIYAAKIALSGFKVFRVAIKRILCQAGCVHVFFIEIY